ncbi:hypothetical protein BLX41_21940 [Pseudomonas protegens]|nr:hypothetical protein BLX41_21940 [Pseudomonas protegens]
MMQEFDGTQEWMVTLPVARGRELLNLVNKLRDSKTTQAFSVFEHIQYELSTSIDIVDNPPTWGPWCQ